MQISEIGPYHGTIGFFAGLAVILIITVLLATQLRMTWLGRIQVVLTVLVGIIFAADMKTVGWIHSMAYSNPLRESWQTKWGDVQANIWFGTLITWSLFLIINLIALDSRQRKSDPK